MEEKKENPFFVGIKHEKEGCKEGEKMAQN